MADEQLYLDYEGLATFKGELNGVDLIKATGNGNAYTATIPNVTALKRGMIITIIPDTTSTATIPTLNVNGLGVKSIKQRLSLNTSLTAEAATESWMVANKPVTLLFDGTQWVTITGRPAATTLYGTVPIESGGTGAETAAEALAKLGAVPTTRTINGKPLTSDIVIETGLEATNWVNVNINTSYVKTTDELRYKSKAGYEKYGNLVLVGFTFHMKESAGSDYHDYTLATGFPTPKPYLDPNTNSLSYHSYWFTAVDHETQRSYPCYIDDGDLIVKVGKESITSSSSLCGSGFYLTED